MVSREVDIRNAKLMGGIGAILELVGGFIPYLRWVLPLAGLVLVLHVRLVSLPRSRPEWSMRAHAPLATSITVLH